MKILVTGGLGFIGHTVVRLLENFKHDVGIIDNKTDYGVIPKAELDYLMLERLCRIQTGNITYADISGTLDNSLFEGVDVVVHLASFPRQKVVNRNPVLGSRVMSEGLLNLLEMSVKNSVKRFVYASSSMVYGNFNHNDIVLGIDEATDCTPIGQYGIMKYAGEMLVKDYSRQYGLDYTIVRPSAVYGPYDVTDRVISKFFAAAMRGEELQVHGIDETLDFTYIDDAAMGVVLAATSDDSVNSTYNISRGESHTLMSAAMLVTDIVGTGSVCISKRDPAYPVRGQLSIHRAKTDFGYYPEFDLETGLKEYYDWLKQVPLHNVL
jgi:nucleoside-diphosphate-sugar epimerase